MIVTRTIKYHISPNYTDYDLIKQQADESRQVYNYANYILRQVYFSKSDKNEYSFEFINDYPQLTHFYALLLSMESNMTIKTSSLAMA